MDRVELITLTTDIVASHVSNNNVAVGDIGDVVKRVHLALEGLTQQGAIPQEETRQPIVSVRSSVKPDTITCLICGKKQSMLKRHLQASHGMTTEQYRAEFDLPASYPMVAPNYAALRKELAVKIGLGRKPAAKALAKPSQRKSA
jgi:predicted transcriptional regulator